ncbi:MAG: PAS domain-containing protein [Elusimicrobia bacterium]|nr:PAS domain-containing protein [Elusimicrobiota bacterium]
MSTQIVGLHESVLESLPGGLIVVDLEGSVLVLNRSAQKILGIDNVLLQYNSCRSVFAGQPELVDILLGAAKTLEQVNRKEVYVNNAKGERLLLGYGTLVFRDNENKPIGVGITFQDITKFVPLPLNVQFISLVNRYFMPFAVLMVTTALIWGLAEKWEKYTAAGILAGVVAFNYFMGWHSKRIPEGQAGLKRLHIPINFIALGVMVYFLGTLWGPMWLLFLLTPLAASLYAGRLTTVIVAVLSAGVLLGIYYQRGLTGTIGWVQVCLHAVFIVFVSLFVNSLAGLVSRVRR